MIAHLLHWSGAAFMLITLWAAVQFEGLPSDPPHRKNGGETAPLPETDWSARYRPPAAGLSSLINQAQRPT